MLEPVAFNVPMEAEAGPGVVGGGSVVAVPAYVAVVEIRSKYRYSVPLVILFVILIATVFVFGVKVIVAGEFCAENPDEKEKDAPPVIDAEPSETDAKYVALPEAKPGSMTIFVGAPVFSPVNRTTCDLVVVPHEGHVLNPIHGRTFDVFPVPTSSTALSIVAPNSSQLAALDACSRVP